MTYMTAVLELKLDLEQIISFKTSIDLHFKFPNKLSFEGIEIA